MQSAARTAWMVPPLGVGLYKDALEASVVDGMKRTFALTAFKMNGIRDVPDHPFVKYDVKNELYFLVIDQDDNNKAHYIDAKSLLELMDMVGDAAFSYSYAPTEEAKPMQIPARERQDTAFNKGLMLQNIQAIKTQTSVKVLKPE